MCYCYFTIFGYWFLIVNFFPRWDDWQADLDIQQNTSSRHHQGAHWNYFWSCCSLSYSNLGFIIKWETKLQGLFMTVDFDESLQTHSLQTKVIFECKSCHASSFVMVGYGCDRLYLYKKKWSWWALIGLRINVNTGAGVFFTLITEVLQSYSSICSMNSISSIKKWDTSIKFTSP